METPQKETREPPKTQRPGIEPLDSMPAAGRKILGFHFKRMVQHEPGTRIGQNISDLHKMRVATRRMRVGLTILSPYYEKSLVDRYTKGLRKTAKALGRVRDYDVFLDHFSIYQKNQIKLQTPEDEVIVSGWETARANAQSKMLKYLESKKHRKFVKDFKRFINSPSEESYDKDEPVVLARNAVPKIISNQMAVIQEYNQIMENATIKELHALRIEFKKLRYAVEFFQELLGPEAQSVITEIVKFQDHLGKLNDADVACKILNSSLSQWEELQKETQHFEGTNPGLVTNYLIFREREKENLVATFPQLWQKFLQGGFSQNLGEALTVL